MIQLYSGQNQILKALENFCENLKGDISKQEEQNSFFSQKRLETFISTEVEKFQKLIHKNYTIKETEIKKKLEELSSELESFSSFIRNKFNEFTQETWAKNSQIALEKAQQLHKTIQSTNIREALEQISGAVFLENYRELGESNILQWPRKIWHMLAGLFIVWFYLFSYGSFKTKMIIAGTFTLYTLFCDVLRFFSPKYHNLVMRDLQKFMRKKEVNRLNSMTFYAVSCVLVCALFSKPAAMLAILFLALGDPLASIIGIKFGKHKIKHLSIEGCATFFIVCALTTFFTYPYLSGLEIPFIKLLLFSILAGIIGMSSEWYSFKLDDNFTIPVLSAIGITILQFLFF